MGANKAREIGTVPRA